MREGHSTVQRIFRSYCAFLAVLQNLDLDKMKLIEVGRGMVHFQSKKIQFITLQSSADIRPTQLPLQHAMCFRMKPFENMTSLELCSIRRVSPYTITQ